MADSIKTIGYSYNSSRAEGIYMIALCKSYRDWKKTCMRIVFYNLTVVRIVTIISQAGSFYSVVAFNDLFVIRRKF